MIMLHAVSSMYAQTQTPRWVSNPSSNAMLVPTERTQTTPCTEENLKRKKSSSLPTLTITLASALAILRHVVLTHAHPLQPPQILLR